VQQLHDTRREHVWAKEQCLRNAATIACEASAGVGAQEAMQPFDEQLEVVRVCEGEKSPTESSMVELIALFTATSGPQSSQMCCLRRRVPLTKRCLPEVFSPSWAVGSNGVSDV